MAHSTHGPLAAPLLIDLSFTIDFWSHREQELDAAGHGRHEAEAFASQIEGEAAALRAMAAAAEQQMAAADAGRAAAEESLAKETSTRERHEDVSLGRHTCLYQSCGTWDMAWPFFIAELHAHISADTEQGSLKGLCTTQFAGFR